MYLYFIESGGKNIPENAFSSMFNVWLRVIIGVDPRTGMQQIVTFLDKKFGN